MFQVFLLSAGGLYPVMLRRRLVWYPRSLCVLDQWPVSAESPSLFCVWLINLILKSHVPALPCGKTWRHGSYSSVDFPTFPKSTKMMLMNDFFFLNGQSFLVPRRSEEPRSEKCFGLLPCFPPTALNGFSRSKLCSQASPRTPCLLLWMNMICCCFSPLALPCLQSKLPLINLKFPLHSTSLLLFTWLILLHFLSPLKSASAPVPGGSLDLNNSEQA